MIVIKKKMILSSQGKVIFQTLDSFFPAVEEIFESLVNHKNTDVKFLRIGFCPTLSPDVRFKLSFGLIEDPNYTVKIHQGENSYLVDAFNQDEIDLLFSTNKNITPKGNYRKKVIGSKKFSLVCNKNLFSKIKNKKSLSSLHEQKFINYTSDSELHFKIYDLLHQKNIHPIRVAEIDDINLIKQTLINLDCFAILPENSIKPELKEKQLFKVSTSLSKLDMKVTAFYKTKFEEERFKNHLVLSSKSIS